MKRWLRIILFALIAFGPMGSTWAQVRCISIKTAVKSNCCCPSSVKSDHCPMPKKNTDSCPMFKESSPSAILPAAAISPKIVFVSFGNVDLNISLPLKLSYERTEDHCQSFHRSYLEKCVPQFRAPPVSPLAA